MFSLSGATERQLDSSALAQIKEILQTYSDARHYNIEDLVKDVSECVKHEGLVRSKLFMPFLFIYIDGPILHIISFSLVLWKNINEQ